MNTRALTLSGYQNSGPLHWQSLWGQRANVKRVQQDDWDSPVCSDWYARLSDEILASDSHVVLAARGHINSDSGLADWPQAWALLEPWLTAS